MAHPLPPNSYAVMVEKLYADRVKRFFFAEDEEVVPRSVCRSPSRNDGDAPEASPLSDASLVPDGRMDLLDSTGLTGVSRARRGYFLLLLEHVRRPLAAMSPLGRRHISFMGRVTHRYALVDTPSDNESAAYISREVFGIIWESVVKEGFDLERETLRIECHPRDRMDAICRRLDEAAQASIPTEESSSVPKNTSDEVGPIQFTASRSRCTHRLTILWLPSQQVLWGLENRRDHAETMVVALNDQASSEIHISPEIPASDKNSNPPPTKAIDIRTPLSRAYYKLQEVWTNYLQPHRNCCLNLTKDRVGLDIGAAPGGWTQVMVHSMGLGRVVALDTAQLATRVSTLPQVTHVATRTDQDPSGKSWQGLGPFQIVVCDASVLWSVLLEGLLQTFRQTGGIWELPLTLVITLKLPFKTLGSVERHVLQISERMKTYEHDLAGALFPMKKVRSCHRVVHLMANSDSERTLIVVFLGEESK